MAIITIQEWIRKRKERYFELPTDIAKLLGVSDALVCMLQRDKTRGVRLDLAITIYKIDKTVIHPFSEESILYEMEGVKNV